MRRDGDRADRITDLSSISPENFKYRNTQFLIDSKAVYETGLETPQTELRRRIWNVRNGDLQRVIDEFPLNEPARDQCALWMHAVVGKHFFPDANHRTAVALLRMLLADNDLVYTGFRDTNAVSEIRDRSHAVRAEIEPVRLDTLYRRDDLYAVWREFFELGRFEKRPENE